MQESKDEHEIDKNVSMMLQRISSAVGGPNGPIMLYYGKSAFSLCMQNTLACLVALQGRRTFALNT